jgi:sugar phosphate isomerase/epimerase
MFTLSLAHASLLNLSPPDLIRVAAATGYRFVGLRLIPLGRPGEIRHTFADNPGSLRETRRALAETGVRILDVEVAQIKDGLDPASYRPALEEAAELGVRYVLTNVYTPDRSAAEDGVGVLCDLAASLGLNLALEFVSFSDLSTLAQTIDLMRAANRRNAVVLVDALHFHASGEPLSALASLSADQVRFVHVCDGPRDVPSSADDRRRIAREERLLPGEGGIDVAGILRHLPSGIIYAVEAHNPARAAAMGPAAYAQLAHDKTTRCLETAFGEARPTHVRT